jgi:hypothetical protein
MQSIDVSDLPEPYVTAVKAVVDAFRRQLSVERGNKARETATKAPVALPHWPLGVIGTLSREEIYDDIR